MDDLLVAAEAAAALPWEQDPSGPAMPVSWSGVLAGRGVVGGDSDSDDSSVDGMGDDDPDEDPGPRKGAGAGAGGGGSGGGSTAELHVTASQKRIAPQKTRAPLASVRTNENELGGCAEPAVDTDPRGKQNCVRRAGEGKTRRNPNPNE